MKSRATREECLHSCPRLRINLILSRTQRESMSQTLADLAVWYWSLVSLSVYHSCTEHWAHTLLDCNQHIMSGILTLWDRVDLLLQKQYIRNTKTHYGHVSRKSKLYKSAESVRQLVRNVLMTEGTIKANNYSRWVSSNYCS